MPTIRIGRLSKRYRLPANGDARTDRERLDRVLSAMLDAPMFETSMIEAAFARAGIDGTDEICIRRVESLVRLDADRPDPHMAAAWSVALADAIAEQLRTGGPDVIRFPSRFEALVDMACSAARADFTRAWAWRTLGVWTADDYATPRVAADEVLARLTTDARVAPVALDAVATRGALPLLVRDATPHRWVVLVRAVLAAFGVSDATAQRLLAHDGFGADDEQLATTRGGDGAHAIAGEASRRGAIASHDIALRARRLVATTAMLQADRLASRPHDAAEVAARRARVVLGLIAAEPSLVVADYAPAIVDGIVEAIVAHEPPGAAADERAAKAHAARERVTSTHVAPPDAIADPDARTPVPTAFGGLLFVLHVVRELALFRTLPAQTALARRPLGWMLHQLAQRLTGAPATDAAVLAFAGLGPRATPPSHDTAPCTEAEDDALQAAQEQIVEALRAKLSWETDADDRAIVAFVTTRRAHVLADPGWIDGRFAAGDASTEIRRAGLDRDPGWLPWLGVVVRFVYA